jgi:hypothetical protein
MPTPESLPALLALADELALRRLSARYAAGADGGSGDTYAHVFLPDGRLRVHRPDDVEGPAPATVGHEALATVPGRLRQRYVRTFHLLGQALYEIGDDEATGEVYCLAHHLAAGSDAHTSHVMHMRYEDAYRRDDRGDWKIAERDAHIDWTETRPADAPGPPRRLP